MTENDNNVTHKHTNDGEQEMRSKAQSSFNVYLLCCLHMSLGGKQKIRQQAYRITITATRRWHHPPSSREHISDERTYAKYMQSLAVMKAWRIELISRLLAMQIENGKTQEEESRVTEIVVLDQAQDGQTST